ncbi:hypothetical protein DXV75_01590 [Alteromonas aestuariivivens]|uniref:Uncharacterized protein n=1 Tax=Alteromonas aestuariivivens TaxID=1938339 RepID=A0A3D8ME82_9ALTE|nr:hypothetical protein [Alteromonas aestuariivivens]RDV29179.1 hypothetical protein DXV75_01590 [Alteromonas aestuariivivens]
MIAVLTGDLVHSSKMSQPDFNRSVQAVETFIADCTDKYGAQGYGYRGDAFQLMFPEPQPALNAALQFKLALGAGVGLETPADCTLSLAYGEGTVSESGPRSALGEAYVCSGRNLDRAARGSIHVAICGGSGDEEMGLLCEFLSHLLGRLTTSQKQLLHSYLESGFAEHRVLAQQLHTSRQNISQRLAAIGAELVRDFVYLVNTRVGG